MKIGIVNAGNIGMNLATGWIRQGHDIMLSKDTHSDQLQERFQKHGKEHGLTETQLSRFKYGSLIDAAKFGDVVVFSVYFPRMKQVFKEFADAGVTLEGKIVIDTMNPLNVDPNFNHYHDLEYMKNTSTTEDVQKAFPKAAVYKTFCNMAAFHLDARQWPKDRIPVQIFIGGNSFTLATVRKLIEDTEFRPIFAGHELKTARLLENLGILFHHVVENEYKGEMPVAWDLVKQK